MVMVCHGSHSWLWMGRHCWDERNVKKKCARFPTEIAWTPQQSTSHRCVCHAFQANLHWCVLLVGNFQDVRLKFPNCLALQAVQVAFANEKWLRYDFGWWACHHNDCHFWIVSLFSPDPTYHGHGTTGTEVLRMPSLYGHGKRGAPASGGAWFPGLCLERGKRYVYSSG